MSTAHRLPKDLFDAAQVGKFLIADPGDGGEIVITKNFGVCRLTHVTGSETRSLPTASEKYVGVYLLLYLTNSPGGASIDVQSGTAVFDGAGDYRLLTVVDAVGSYFWCDVVTGGGVTGLALDTLTANTSVTTPTIAERTTGAGVAIDGAKIRDGQLMTVNTVTAETSTTPTLTAAELYGGLITSTNASAVTATLDTGTAMDTALGAVIAIGQGFEWSLINLGSSSGAATVTASSAHTVVGGGVVAITTSKRFYSKRTAANTWITYELA